MGTARTKVFLGLLGLITWCLSCGQSLEIAPVASEGLAAGQVPEHQIGGDAAVGSNDAPEPVPPVFVTPLSPDLGEETSDRDDAIAILQGQDSDGDGRTDFDEILLGTDPIDPTDGPDVDGDGIPNGEDDDVDGDGIPNGEDDDVDGDGVSNSMDDDDDGDGEPDATDDDDNGDGDDDCGCDNGTCEPVSGSCICDEGWKGSHCDLPDCRGIGGCNYGTCIGPNTCRCNPGWESVGDDACNSFHCRGRRDCSGASHGTCVGPNACDCHADWKGSSDCSRHTCAASPSVCDDHDACTDDHCDPNSGCSHTEVECIGLAVCALGRCVAPCSNTSQCETGQSCRDGGCLDECEQDSDCFDGDACTVDTCDPQAGCSSEAFPCDLTETCQRGRCVSPCEEDDDCGEGRCREGGCTNGCLGDSNCREGENCEDGACLPPQEGEEQEP